MDQSWWNLAGEFPRNILKKAERKIFMKFFSERVSRIFLLKIDQEGLNSFKKQIRFVSVLMSQPSFSEERVVELHGVWVQKILEEN